MPHRPPPPVRFVRLGMPDTSRHAPPASRMTWQERVLLVGVYTVAGVAIVALIVGLGLIRLP